MQGNKILTANKQSGFSLVELMIAIVLGLLLTAAVTAMAVNSLKMNSQTLKSARLNQDVGAVMQIMVNDIRRVGYAICVDDPTTSPPVECHSTPHHPPSQDIEYKYLPSTNTDEDINIVSATCVLYSYNRNSDNVKDNVERQGFKLENNQLKVRTSCGTDDVYDDDVTSAMSISCATDCSVGAWVALTDPDIIKITEFLINTENSKCHNIDDDISVRIKPGVSATAFACSEINTNRSNAQEWIVAGDGTGSWGDLSDTTILPLYKSGTPTLNVGIHHVNISLEAELTRDPAVSKNLDVSIKVRNDHVYK